MKAATDIGPGGGRRPDARDDGERTDAAGAPVLEGAAVDLPPRPGVLDRGEIAGLAAALALHAILLAALLPGTGIGAGGSDLEAIGVDIVTVAPALDSRLTLLERSAASADRAVAPVDGEARAALETAPSPEAQERTRPERPQSSEAAPRADLVVRDWQLRPTLPDAASQEPVIARESATGEREKEREIERPAEVAMRPQPETAMPQAPSEARTEGGAASRGTGEIDVASAVLAAVRAGQRDRYGLSVFEALRSNTPRSPPGREGIVEVEFSVRSDGTSGTQRVVRSSGSRELEAAALAAVRSTRFPAPPPMLSGRDLLYTMTYTFRLPGAR